MPSEKALRPCHLQDLGRTDQEKASVVLEQFTDSHLLVGAALLVRGAGEFVFEALGWVANFGNGGAIMRLSSTNAISAASPIMNESAASGADRLG
jgi:hypothetical protein